MKRVGPYLLFIASPKLPQRTLLVPRSFTVINHNSNLDLFSSTDSAIIYM